MKKQLLTVAMAIGMTLSVQSAFAEYTGAGSNNAGTANTQSGYSGPSSIPSYNTIAEIKKNPVDEVRVTLTGYLIEQVSREQYTFSDGKDSILVEIDDEDMPPVQINEKTKLQIVGDTETGAFEKDHIEVEYIQVL